MDDLHHLKYEHNIDRDDALFDSAYKFFTESMKNECDIDKCTLVDHHYRDRDQPVHHQEMEVTEDLLMDSMAMVHCYFLHSFDTQRLTKTERQSIMKLTGSTSWKAITDVIRSDDLDDDVYGNEESANMNVVSMVSGILATKTRRGRNRFRDVDDDDEKTVIEDVLDFAAMADTVGVEEQSLRDGLAEYEKDRNKFISDLIDVIYSDDPTQCALWSKLELEDDAKGAIFQKTLYGHFKCVQLNTTNMSKLFRYIVGRKRLQIDMERMNEMLITNNIDGRMFDKNDAEHYQKNGIFAKRFKGIPDCKLQHVRQLYGTMKKWKYVEVKKVVVEAKEEEEEEDVEEEEVASEVYTIGKRFVFWKSQRTKKDYVEAKYKDMKEEMLQSPLLSVHFPGISTWNRILAKVNALVGTKAALKISSNGMVCTL